MSSRTVGANSSRDIVSVHEVHFNASLYRLHSQLTELNEVIRTYIKIIT